MIYLKLFVIILTSSGVIGIGHGKKENFREKNFTVLSVSLDKPDGKGSWLAAIQRDGLEWTNVSDLKYWNNAAAQLYHVTSIPSNILVDPSGKIIGKNLRGDQLRSKLCEVLGCN